MPRLRGDNSDLYSTEGDSLDQPLTYTNPAPPQPGPEGTPGPVVPPAPGPTPGPTNPTEWSRGQEDQWINFANQNYGGSANGTNINDIINNYNKTFNTNAKVVGNDKVDFGYGASDVIKDVGGKNQLWLGDYPDPNHVSPNSGGGPSGNQSPVAPGSPSSYTPWTTQGDGTLASFMGQSAPVHKSQNFDEIMGNLKQLFPNGAYNQDIVNRRTENARENLLRQRKSTDANDRAILANRGTLGSGPEITALTRADQNTADQYQNATSGIYADESHNADQRMISALQTAAGMDANEAAAYVNAYNAQTGRGLGVGNLGVAQGNLGVAQQRANNDFTLGSGNLALGNVNSANNYNLGLGQLGLGRDTALNNATDQRLGRVIELLKSGISLDEILAGGYLGN